MNEWEVICKRTEDPKLAYFEETLDHHGIEHRRNGESFHAPILEVPTGQAEEAWRLLSEKIDGRVFDEIPDDDPMFDDWRR